MEQSYVILEQESSHVFLLRAGKGRLESHRSNAHRQNPGCVTAHHQGVRTGDRCGAESTSTMPDPSQPDGILRLAPLAKLVLKPEQTRGELCSRAPLTPCAHIHQWGMALHLNSDFCWNSCSGHKPMEPSPVWTLQGFISAHPDARVTAVQSHCQVATMASYQPLIDSLNSSAWSLLLQLLFPLMAHILASRLFFILMIQGALCQLHPILHLFCISISTTKLHRDSSSCRPRLNVQNCITCELFLWVLPSKKPIWLQYLISEQRSVPNSLDLLLFIQPRTLWAILTAMHMLGLPAATKVLRLQTCSPPRLFPGVISPQTCLGPSEWQPCHWAIYWPGP